MCRYMYISEKLRTPTLRENMMHNLSNIMAVNLFPFTLFVLLLNYRLEIYKYTQQI